MTILSRYARWLHTRWPAGRVEALPESDSLGRTNIPGVYIAGDLKGIPLFKFAIESGVNAVRLIAATLPPSPRSHPPSPIPPHPSPLVPPPSPLDLLIIGAGVAGMAAALEARRFGLSFQVIEANEPFSTVVNFPKGKPIYTYPPNRTPPGTLQVSATQKESLLEELIRQTRDVKVMRVEAKRIRKRSDGLVDIELASPASPNALTAKAVIIAIGQSGQYRTLNVPGERLDKVYNRLHDPKDFAGIKCLVVGGGDSALESAIALAEAGANTTISYRGSEFARAKAENAARASSLMKDSRLTILWESEVRRIEAGSVFLKTPGGERSIPNDTVFVMIGREAPLDFFRRSGLRIRNEWTKQRAAGCLAFVAFCYLLYSWKAGGWLGDLFYRHHWWPTSLPHPSPLPPGEGGSMVGILSILRVSAAAPAFWYTLAYSAIVTIFGIMRIRRRRTPYVTRQTLTLMAIQVIPLFLLPEIILPWMGVHGILPTRLADALFPVVHYGHGREYWRAYGFIFAWPLMIYNVFTHRPLAWWLAISLVQTFVIIPALVYRWGKGAYCGWICSCGALAETLGDNQRSKMPHGPLWNRLNLAGQAILGLTFLMLLLRVIGWIWPGSWADRLCPSIENNYKWIVDVGLGGIIGVGLYFWFSGRVWCRFFCPLAALMHIYARFSRFRIFAEKKKCISCNVCTTACHQGIDVMNFANKGLPMEDPQCVRCSACVQSCPTEVLAFGRLENGRPLLDKLSTRR